MNYLIIAVVALFVLCALGISGTIAYDYYYSKHAEKIIRTKVLGEIDVEHDGSKKSKFQFDASATGFSVQNAGFLCDACIQVYNEPSDCHKWALDNGFTEDFFFFQSNEYNPNFGTTQGFVAKGPDAILVAFRGSEWDQMGDILADLSVNKVSWQNAGNAHKGFYDGFFHVWGKMFTGFEPVVESAGGEHVVKAAGSEPVTDTPPEKVEAFDTAEVGTVNNTSKGRFRSVLQNVFPGLLRNHGNRKVWITGHSLGGALAGVCAAQCEMYDAIPVHAVYTYGQPRFADSQLAAKVSQQLGDKYYRIVNNQDAVPSFAPYSMNYRQFGNEVFYNESKQSVIKQNQVESSSEKALGTLLLSLTTQNPFQYLSFTPSLGFLQDTEASVKRKIDNTSSKQFEDHRITTGYRPLFDQYLT